MLLLSAARYVELCVGWVDAHIKAAPEAGADRHRKLGSIDNLTHHFNYIKNGGSNGAGIGSISETRRMKYSSEFYLAAATYPTGLTGSMFSPVKGGDMHVVII